MVAEKPDESFIRIFYTRLDFGLPKEHWLPSRRELSGAQLEKMNRYVQWEDRLRCLAGIILIRRILDSFGLSTEYSKDLRVTDHGRPFVDLPFDFNLSHSGNYVICAGSHDCRVGIDVEECRPIDFQDFEQVMTPEQWHRIEQSSEPFREFFRLWALKESVIKAEGRGLSLPLDRIEEKDGIVRDGAMAWRTIPLEIDPDYAVCLTTDAPYPVIELQAIELVRF